jgi:hypothetical protein
MTKYIIKYQNGSMIILSGEEAEKEYDKEFKGNWETNVEIKHENEKSQNSNESNDSLTRVLTMPILNMFQTMFIPFLSIEYNSEEKNEE